MHDGDELIALAARGMAARGELGGGVAVTVMSNYGFHRAMEEAGIEVAVTKVGDRYVLDELRERGWAARRRAVRAHHRHPLRRHRRRHRRGADDDAGAGRARSGRRPSPMEKLPQTLVNVEVADRDAVAGAAAVWEAVEREGAALEGRGRVLLRPSGTEPLVRVMVEAPSAEEADAVCERLVAIVRQELA